MTKTISSNDYAGRIYADRGECYYDSIEEYLEQCVADMDDPDADLWTTEDQMPEIPSAEEFIFDHLRGEGLDDELIARIAKPARIAEMQSFFVAWFSDPSLRTWNSTRTRIVISDEHRALFAAMVAE